MRRLGILASAWLVLAGCAAPPSDGGLWARQGLQQELAVSRQTDAQRAAQAHAYELTLADEALRTQADRIEAELKDCPGQTRTPMRVAPASSIRDAIRVRIGDDAQRRATLGRQALTDWYLRRARATGDPALCERARTAQPAPNATAQLPVGPPDPIDVTRTFLPDKAVIARGQPSDVLVTLYALGWADGVRAPSPLPEYIRAVYGGSLNYTSSAASVISFGGRATLEDLLDDEMPLYPDIEPDAIWRYWAGP
jgi:hypothetical protein